MADERQYVVFLLEGQEYGAPIEAVREVGVYQTVTHLPATPDYVQGVINLRGQVIPVIDLRRRLGLPHRDAGADTRIMVMEGGNLTGMVVDGVREVVRIRQEDIEPPEHMAGNISPTYLRGVAKLADRLILLVNVERLLGSGAGSH